MKRKIGIFIEARTGSTRLPGKILKKINSKTSIIEFLIDRIQASLNFKNLIIITTKKKEDDRIIRLCKKKNILFFRGSTHDLIKRNLDAAKKFQINDIIQLTSDNPFIDINILKKLKKIYLNKNYEFVSNSVSGTFPIGSDIRIFKVSSLKKYSIYVKKKFRQHTCYYFLKNSKKINSHDYLAPIRFRNSKIRLTVDYYEDLIFAKKLVSLIGENLKDYTLKNIFRVINKSKNYKINYKKGLKLNI
jgi:spore coat polysaccharide biosynthesis protein SpsF